MQSEIENYTFILEEDKKTITINKDGMPFSVLHAGKPIEDKKAFDTECAYWWMEFRD